MIPNQSPKGRIRIRILLVSSLITSLILFGIFSVSCQPTTPTAEPTTPTAEPTESTSVEVEISDYAFVPDTITIPVGTTVTWINRDHQTHTVTSDTDLFYSGGFASGAPFSHTFTERGTFGYHCGIHPMEHGTVIVE